MPQARAILHVDMDAFYASVEQRDDPSLRGQPLIVGGTTTRGVVAAASYEVRRYGVRSAMPMRRALQLCPHAVCVRPRMSHYQDVSRVVFGVFHEVTPEVEGLSLDEAFLDVTHSLGLMGDAVTIARRIKARIRELTQLTASVGVAPNKLVAKIASELDKPDGLTIAHAGRLHELLDPLPVKRLPGLGRKAGDAVLAAGITTLGQLRAAPDAVLWPLFGRDLARMRDRAAGIDDRPVVADCDERSISAEETFDVDIGDPAKAIRELLALADRASSRLRGAGFEAASVTVKIRQHDFTTQTRQKPLVPATNDSRRIAVAARELLERWLTEHRGARLRLLGVGVSQLAPRSQPDLFAAPAVATPLDATLDRIRERFGQRAVTRAGKLPKD